MAEDKARAAEQVEKAKTAEAAIGIRPASVLVKRIATQGVVKRPQTPQVRRRGF